MNNKNYFSTDSHKNSPQARFLSRGVRRLNRYYQKWFKNRNHIFVYNGSIKPIADFPYKIECYEKFNDIPLKWQEMIKSYSENTIEILRLEMEKNGILWLAILEQQIVGYMMSRYGRHFKKWYVDLQADDIVLGFGQTYPDFRGKGIAPLLMNHIIMNSLQQQESKAYADCRISNTSSIRSIEKVFKHIATKRRISRDQAL